MWYWIALLAALAIGFWLWWGDEELRKEHDGIDVPPRWWRL